MENNIQENKPKKGSSAVLPIIMILLVLLAGVGGWYLGETWLKTEEKIEDTLDDSNDENKSTTINIGELEQLVQKYEFSSYLEASSVNTVTSDIYTEIGVNKDIIDMIVLMNLSFKETITLEEYKETLRELFGIEVANSYEPSDIDYDATRKYPYDENSETFTYVPTGGLGGAGFPIQQRKVYEVTKEDNMLKVRVAVGVCSLDETGTTYDKNCSNLDFEKVGNESGWFNLDNHYDQLTKFEYVFEKEEETDSYYFKDITKLN